MCLLVCVCLCCHCTCEHCFVYTVHTVTVHSFAVMLECVCVLFLVNMMCVSAVHRGSLVCTPPHHDDMEQVHACFNACLYTCLLQNTLCCIQKHVVVHPLLLIVVMGTVAGVTTVLPNTHTHTPAGTGKLCILSHAQVWQFGCK